MLSPAERAALAAVAEVARLVALQHSDQISGREAALVAEIEGAFASLERHLDALPEETPP